MNLQFLPAEKEDIPVIYAQAKNLIDNYEDVASIDYDNVLAWVNRKISSCIAEYCKVCLDGEVCGYYRLCQDGELDDLYILPLFQNRGIGSEILKKCMKDSLNPIYLYVFSRNIRAISFYERFGFAVKESVGNTRLILWRKG